MTQDAPDLDATDARQARKGRRAFVILAVSLALAVLALGAMVLSRVGDLAGRGGQTTAPAQVARNVDTEPSTIKQTAQTAPPGSVAAQAAGRTGGPTTNSSNPAG
jgi:heme A synthase